MNTPFCSLKAKTLITSLAGASLLALFTGQASGLNIIGIPGAVGAAATGDTLTAGVLAPASGINVVGGSITYQGTTIPTLSQAATYTGFTLAPSSGNSPTLTLPDGIFLTSGNANIPFTNTSNSFSASTQSGPNAQLGALSASAGNTSSTFDANVLSFQFTVAPGQTSVDAKFVFGTEEFPTQSVTDIFGFFVDGVNFAKFANGQLISNTPGNPTNFILNPVGGGLYPIEFNGLTEAFNVVGILDPNLTTHTVTIGIADTSDTIFESGVFIGALKTGTDTGGGGINPGVPDSGTTIAMLGAALAGIAGFRRKFGV